MLSIIIPARNEVYLEQTIKNILSQARGEIEILVFLDGYLPKPPIDTKDSRVIFYHYEKSIGQRQCVNKGAEFAKGKYIMKLDAHCAVDEGFDVKLAEDCEYNWTVIPRMYNLDVETWKPKLHKRTDYMYITSPTSEKPFRAMYYGSRQPKNDKLIDDTMCNMGPSFFMHKDRFWELGGMDESHGGWGQMGVEVSLKAWLSGGSLKVNKKTWFAHWFRGGGGSGFPWKITGKEVKIARKHSQDIWLNDKWDKATRKLQWVIDKFNPPGWREKDLTILFYTANVISNKILEPVLRSLKRHGLPIVSISQEPMDLGKNIVVPKEQSLQNIYKQVLKGAQQATTKYIVLCEDDCLYVPEHFHYRPKKPFAYNLNRWLLHLDDKVFSYRKRPVLSQCIADRETLIKNLEERFKLPEIPDKYCGEMGCFEKQLGMMEYEYETFETKEPNLVICHKNNTLGNRKLLGKDAEPRTTLEPYGNIDYWINKFIPDKIRKQVSYIAGKRFEIDELINNIDTYWDYRKKDRVKYFKSAVIPFFQEVHEGKTFTDEELEKHPYFDYLKYRMRPETRDTERVRLRCLELIKTGMEVYHSVKKNGMYHPIDMFWRGHNLHIYRGTRRIVIAKLLGYKHITARCFKNLKVLGKLLPNRHSIPDDITLHGIAIKQFNKYDYMGTDKFWTHGYTPLYDFHLTNIRDKVKKVLEIGVFYGASLLLWRDFFPNSYIYGVDKDTSKATMVKGLDKIKLLNGRQGDADFFKKEVIPCGKFDLIIDDCSHKTVHQKESLELLWDSLESGGFYVIEDMYWRGIKDPTAMNKLKDMIDKLNCDLEIESMNFYYNIVFIKKR